MQKFKYEFKSTIRFSEVDHTQNITLPGIINYFQDCSIFHSEEIGVGVDFLAEKGHAWVLSSWQVVVDRYPKMGEEVTISTWATGFKGMIGNRNFAMEDKDGNMVAYANSIWVYMDVIKGRPIRPSKEEIELYGSLEPLEMEYADRKITLPEGAEQKDSFPVRRYHIDTNEHVNNCQYVQMALESLDKEAKIHQMRAEYKNSAKYEDIIFPKVAKENDRTVVELCDGDGGLYAVVEFTA